MLTASFLDSNADKQPGKKEKNAADVVLSTVSNNEAADTDSSQASDETLSDNDDLSERINIYLQTRAKIMVLEAIGPTKSFSKRKARLQERLQRFERDILFDRDQAERRWQNMLSSVQVDIARQKLELRSRSEVEVNDQATTATGASDAGLMESDGDDNLANLFREDTTTTLPESESQSTLRVRDFGTWTGRHPAEVLKDMFKLKKDQGQIHYARLTVSCHANRRKITLSWTRPFTYEETIQPSIFPELRCSFRPCSMALEMMSVATTTISDAEAYISTAALYCFLPNKADARLHVQKLPIVWRDLFAEFVDRKDTLLKENMLDDLRMSELVLRGSLASSEQGTLSNSEMKALHAAPKSDLANSKRPSTSIFSYSRALSEWERRSKSAAFSKMLAQRRQLPIHKHKLELLEMVKSNRVSILCSETGSGKSTQVPTLLLEESLTKGQDCQILITQPRRISAITLARRVSQELGESPGNLGTTQSLVGYTIRMESKLSSSTRITFATTGVVLRMLESSPDLDQYDYLVLDEVHERTLEIDLIFIVLQELLTRSSKLKVLLMSATINTDLMSTYFSGAPVLRTPGRSFQVKVKFLEDVVDEVYEASEHVHTSVSNEHVVVKKSAAIETAAKPTDQADSLVFSERVKAYLEHRDVRRIDFDLIVRLITMVSTRPDYDAYSSAILVFMPGLPEMRRLQSLLLAEKMFRSGWTIHLLHSTFSSEDLELAFQVPPSGIRKLVLATNIAETGITIPDISMVIDTCKEKIMRYDDKRQRSALREGFIARSSGQQRRGRAGRVRDGLCFHLVTRSHFESLPEQATPEMLRLSLQYPILRVKMWKLGYAEEILSKSIQPPTGKNIRAALTVLKDVGALDGKESLTALGRQIAQLPLDVELAKLCLLGAALNCIDAATTVAAIVSSRSPYVNDTPTNLIDTYKMYNAWKQAITARNAVNFCERYYLSHRALVQIAEQKMQLLTSMTDVGIIEATSQEKQDLRYHRMEDTGQLPGFIKKYDGQSQIDDWVRMVIATAFYPKMLVRQERSWRNVITNQLIEGFVESDEKDRNSTRWLTFASARQGKRGRYEVSNVSEVPSWVIALQGQAIDIDYFAQLIRIDGSRVQLKFNDSRAMLALKFLRDHIIAIVDKFLQDPRAGLRNEDQFWFDVLSDIARLRVTQEQKTFLVRST